MHKIVMLLIVGGAMLAWHGYKEYRLNQSISPECKSMTCAELERDGPGDNAHVRVSHLLLGMNGFVGQRHDKTSPWSTVWIPAVSSTGRYAQDLRNAIQVYGPGTGNLPQPRNLHVIIKSTHTQTQEQIESLCRRSTIEGVVINKVESLDSKETSALARQYPGVDFATCWILEEGREPTSSTAALGFMGGGAVAFLGGFVLVATHH